MRVIAVNAGPRKGWNTDMLIQEAAKGAAENGAEIEFVDLFKLEKFTGCISCFGCKLGKNAGTCIHKDGLTETLEKIRSSDALIIGSPLYFGDLTASFRALYERLMFQYLTSIRRICAAIQKRSRYSCCHRVMQRKNSSGTSVHPLLKHIKQR